MPRIQHTVLAIDEARAESCESVSFIVQPDQITMTIDLVGAGIEDLEGETVLAHSKYLNNRYGHKKDILAEAVVENGKLIFEFKNRQAPERIWFSVPRLNRWIVPCSRFLYPDSKGNDSIEVLFSSDNVKPVGGDWGKDRPERSGAPDRVYIEE